MKTQEVEDKLIRAVNTLESASERIFNSKGYTRDAKKIRLLIELIKEQMRNENIMPTASTIR
ncbi:MAG: hypothetical protein A2Z20_05745 [Bdellovibrionales bacterium RBG_16_40_8]|nr:MAG: hypothetical protein A2Z20_05745 [Bdellovibrionales bacterium RBG_16_40_8]